jgi:hypothetical protein
MNDDELELRVEARVVGVGTPPPRREISGELRSERFETDGKEYVLVEDAVVEDVDFSGNRFWRLWSDGSSFTRCDFRDVAFESLSFANTKGVTYRECAFDRADLRSVGVEVGRARFERCTFDDALIEGWFSFAGEFVECRFAGKIVECTFHGRPLDEDRPLLDRLLGRRRSNEFRGNDFRHAQLISTVFTRGIDLRSQLWPESDEYVRLDRPQERLVGARAIVSTWPDSNRRRDALVLLDEVYADAWEGQDEVLERRHDPDDPFPEDLIDELWILLEQAT